MNDRKTKTETRVLFIHPELDDDQDPRYFEETILEADPTVISATVVDKGHVQVVHDLEAIDVLLSQSTCPRHLLDSTIKPRHRWSARYHKERLTKDKDDLPCSAAYVFGPFI